jgi:hypothetical protein
MPTTLAMPKPRFVCEAVEGLAGVYATNPALVPKLLPHLRATWEQIPPHVRKMLADHWISRSWCLFGKDKVDYPLSILLLPVVTPRGKPCGASYEGRRSILCVAEKSVTGYHPAALRRLLAHELGHAALLACNKVYSGPKAYWRNEKLVDAVADRWGFRVPYHYGDG